MPEDATWSEVTQKQAQRLSEASQVTTSRTGWHWWIQTEKLATAVVLMSECRWFAIFVYNLKSLHQDFMDIVFVFLNHFE